MKIIDIDVKYILLFILCKIIYVIDIWYYWRSSVIKT